MSGNVASAVVRPIGLSSKILVVLAVHPRRKHGSGARTGSDVDGLLGRAVTSRMPVA